VHIVSQVLQDSSRRISRLALSAWRTDNRNMIKKHTTIADIEAFLKQQDNTALNSLWKSLCKEYYQVENYRLYTDLLVNHFKRALKA